MAWTLNSDVYKNSKYEPQNANVDGFGMNVGGKIFGLEQFKTNSKPLIAVEEIDYVKGKEQMLFVAPFFDHPPLGGLIYSLGVDKNIVKVDQVKADSFRKPALVMAVITVILLYIFLLLLTRNPAIAVLTVIVYSIVPTYLLATRTAFLENVVAPFSIFQLILLFITVKKKSSYFMFGLSGLMAGVCILAKEPAISFTLASIILMFINKIDKKKISIFLISVFIPVLAYVIWGLWLQKDLFIGVFMANSTRGYFGAIKLVTMLEALKFKNFPTDGWWIWGFISFMLISIRIKNKNILFVVIPLAIQLLTVLFLGSPNYPWYFVSSIPLLAACSAIMIWKIAKNPSIAASMAFFLLPFSSSYYWGRVALNIDPSINHYRVVFAVFSILLFIRLKYSKYKIVKWIWFIFLAVLIQKMIVYTQVFMPYLMSHWGSLPVPSLPNF